VRQGVGPCLQSEAPHDHQALEADHPHLSVLQQTVPESVRSPEPHLPEDLPQEHAIRCLRPYSISDFSCLAGLKARLEQVIQLITMSLLVVAIKSTEAKNK